MCNFDCDGPCFEEKIPVRGARNFPCRVRYFNESILSSQALDFEQGQVLLNAKCNILEGRRVKSAAVREQSLSLGVVLRQPLRISEIYSDGRLSTLHHSER